MVTTKAQISVVKMVSWLKVATTGLKMAEESDE
jgi:hypothetical protein